MKIDVYCAGKCRDNGLPTQIASCGIIVVFTDDQNQSRFREFSYGLGGSTLNLANMQAIRLGLASVQSAFRANETTIYTSSAYAAKMMNPDVKPSVNKEIVEEMRKWASYYQNLAIVVDKDNPIVVRAKDLADVALATQINTDSGTKEVAE